MRNKETLNSDERAHNASHCRFVRLNSSVAVLKGVKGRGFNTGTTEAGTEGFWPIFDLLE